MVQRVLANCHPSRRLADEPNTCRSAAAARARLRAPKDDILLNSIGVGDRVEGACYQFIQNLVRVFVLRSSCDCRRTMPDTPLPADNPKIPSDIKIAAATVLVILLVCLGFGVSRPAQADPAPTVLAPQPTSAISPAPPPRLISVVAPGPTPQLTSVAPTAPAPGVGAPSPEQLLVTPPRGLSGLGSLAQVRRNVRPNQLAKDVAQPGAGDMCPIALASARRTGCNTSFHTIVAPR